MVGCEAVREKRKMEREERKRGLESPLIPVSDGNEVGLDNGVLRSEIVEEVKKQLWLAGPLVLVNLLQFCLQMISVMFVGHLGELALSGASMATSFASVTGFSLLRGMGSAIETLCGQSYGAKQYHLLGIHMQRAMLVLMLVSIPLTFIWAYTGEILVALGQDPDISAEAGLYARYMIPSIFAFGLLQCQVRFLKSQNVVVPMMISSGITTLLHILVCWVLVCKSGLGNKGAALANAFSYWINVLLLVIYIKFSPTCKRTWTGFSKEALHGILNFLGLAIPSAGMICLEIWSFEMVVLLSGLLPNPSLNTCSLFYMIPLGLSGATSTRVSNELGAGCAKAARLAISVSLLIVITEGISVGSVMFLIRRWWGYCYSSEEEVVDYVATIMPLLATSYLFDGLQSVLSGAARGCGWQKIGAFVNLGAYYLVGFPSAILFAFIFHVGGKGLWFGIMCGLFVQMLLLLIITLRTNWEQEAKKATERVYSSIIPTITVSCS